MTLAEAKQQIIVSHNADDARITSLIKTARRICEQFSNRAFITQTLLAYLDDFPADEIELPMPPLVSIGSIKYTDTDGNQQTVSADVYTLDTAAEPGIVRLKYNQSWPTTRGDANNVIIEFTAGYGDASKVPEEYKDAIKLQAEYLYEHCESKELVDTAYALLWPTRIAPI